MTQVSEPYPEPVGTGIIDATEDNDLPQNGPGPAHDRPWSKFKPQEVESTGRTILVLDMPRFNANQLHNKAGVTLMHVRAAHLNAHELESLPGDGILFEDLGVAVLGKGDPEKLSAAARLQGSHGIRQAEPEVWHYADGMEDYVRGYRDGVHDLSARIAPAQPATEPLDVPRAASRWADTPDHTWGLQATLASRSARQGAGVRVAVLDTGLDFNHPDFGGRLVLSKSFVPGEDVQDGNGHGTHCVGTVAGPGNPYQPPVYGVAPSCEVLVGKVLSNRGQGETNWILQGIVWAIENGANVVSMSLSSRMYAVSAAYAATAQYAAERGVLLVAAAGNDSYRAYGAATYLGSPANVPGYLAVAAIGPDGTVASFSNRGISPQRAIGVSAPGVNVRSSWLLPKHYYSIDGTSMATPHVAGLAALWLEEGVEGAVVAAHLARSALNLDGDRRDLGAGLAQAP